MHFLICDGLNPHLAQDMDLTWESSRSAVKEPQPGTDNRQIPGDICGLSSPLDMLRAEKAVTPPEELEPTELPRPTTFSRAVGSRRLLWTLTLSPSHSHLGCVQQLFMPLSKGLECSLGTATVLHIFLKSKNFP